MRHRTTKIYKMIQCANTSPQLALSRPRLASRLKSLADIISGDALFSSDPHAVHSTTCRSSLPLISYFLIFRTLRIIIFTKNYAASLTDSTHVPSQLYPEIAVFRRNACHRISDSRTLLWRYRPFGHAREMRKQCLRAWDLVLLNTPFWS